ncbi:hypothetical protein FSARC_5616 [Fusarium sarcochroum]|uniref:Uncharacterized protein n=1 Tax=Fusarium sarcochroum TaxID=1208366 RepID=A0A8H4XA82_9HYPO|nr:hypothetical protein FSARC_5616 [Fusarium sarcochroum]
MSFTKILIASLPALLANQGVSALPTEKNLEGRQCTGCTPPPADAPKNYCPVIDSEENFTGDIWQTGASARSGDTIAVGQSYTVGSSWSIGGDLGLSFEKIIGGSGSLSVSVSESVEISVTQSVESECPDGGEFSCGLHVYPGMKRVKGSMKLMAAGETCPMGVKGKDGKWEMVVPRKDKANNGVFTTELCTCGNLKGADGPNHPEKLCKEECVDPN